MEALLVLALIALVVAALVLIVSGGDIRRYLRMRRM